MYVSVRTVCALILCSYVDVLDSFCIEKKLRVYYCAMHATWNECINENRKKI